MNQITPADIDDGKTQRLANSDALPEIGQWFWVCKNDDDKPWLGCTVFIGSNFVKLNGPAGGRGTYTTRIHVNDIESSLTFVPNHKEVLASKIQEAQNRVTALMDEVKALTSSLGVAPVERIENLGESSGKALATLSSAVDIGAYKKALILAQKETIPALKDSIRSATETLVSWLQAETIPLLAMADRSTDVANAITDRVFNVELYAGLVEEADHFAVGKPAAMSEKLRVFQRMLFCDEEALLAYDSGGMDITNLDSFQEWMSRPENRDRLLPYDRCLLAMRVRRSTKERDWGGSISNLFRNMALADADKSTFLFIRNGENLYRISTGIEFDELIFPDKSSFDPSEPMMIKMSCGRVDKMITRREYDDRVAEYEIKGAERETWFADNPREQWEAANPGRDYIWSNPHDRYSLSFSPREWQPFDNTNVYYDEALQKVSDEVKKYNRVAVIIQGLFDRSDILAPHKPVRSWTPQGFFEAIELIYDGMGLTYGEPPSFEEFRLKCNASIDENSILTGQVLSWRVREAEIECRRIDNNWRCNSQTFRPKEFEPMGDPGPGRLARPSKVMKRAKKVVFTWMRDRRTNSRWNEPPIKATITVPFESLFNISAYKQGDYKVFFRDPRTREKYLQWAPLLITAENYYLKGTEVRDPVR